ncbi:MAG: hypothetical protein ACOYEM_04430 [Bacillota bacterium]|jgi:hypothetical protein
MRRKPALIAALSLCCLLTAFSAFVPFAAAQVSPIQQLVAMEEVLFGAAQEGAVVNRLEIVERFVFGSPGTGTLPERMTKCWNYVQGDRAGEMNLKFKLKAVQWAVFGSIVDGPIVPALVEAEKRILGAEGAGSIGDRIDLLLSMTVPGGQPRVDYALLPKGVLVKFNLETAISSAKSRPGDPVRLVVSDDVIVDGMLVIPKGTVLTGRVLDNVRPTRMGVRARVDVEVEPIEGMDSTPVTLGVDTASITANTDVTLAAGESVRRFAAIGKEGGLFNPNPELEVAAGTEVFLTVMQSAKVLGLATAASAK